MSVITMEARLPPRAHCMPIVRHTHNSRIFYWRSRTGENGAATTHDVMKKKRHGEDIATGELVL